MSKKYLDYDGVLYFWQKIKALFISDISYNSSTRKISTTKNGSASDLVTLSKVATSNSYSDLDNKPTIVSDVKVDNTSVVTNGVANIDLSGKVDKETGKGLSTNDYTTSEKNKLSGIEAGAEVNQNAFSKIKVGNTTIEADGKTDILELVAGSNVTLTPDTTNDKVLIESTDTKATPASATPIVDGTGAVGSSEKYAREDHVHPTDTSRVPTTRKVNNKALSADITLSASDVSAIPTSAKGNANGVCPLNENGVIDSSYIPGMYDDVIEAYPITGATELSAGWLSETSGGSALTPDEGIIYILMADTTSYSANSQFRWSGTTYVKLADGGVTSITNGEIDTILAS